MITIRLIDARRGLHQQCESLFRDKKVADQIYSYLCDGLEECEEVEPERKKGEWINHRNDSGHNIADCSECGNAIQWFDDDEKPRYCCMCGADMRGEQDG